MKIEINYIESVEDILRSYSGRRLQYAIRMGILPPPEKFNLLFSRNTKAENKILAMQPRTKAKLTPQVIRKTFN
jgi:hypothetical protein